MIKHDELTHPNSCMNRARQGEMTFVLLARDQVAPAAIRFWAVQRVAQGKNKDGDPQILEALACADFMEAQRKLLVGPSESKKKSRRK